MRDFTDEQGDVWTATVIEEDTPRHHGRWYLVFHPAGAETPRLAAPEVRWQSLRSARRTIDTMSLFELRRKLEGVKRRAGVPASAGVAASPWLRRVIEAG